MSTIPADVSMIADTAPRATSASRRLPRIAGWALAALVSGGLWTGVMMLARMVL